MKTKLTERLIKNIAPKKTPYEIVDSESNGFLLRVQPSGILTYYLVYRTNEGIKKRYRLGRHGAITLTQARELAKHFSAKALSGQDVQADKKKAQLEKEKTKSRTLGGFVEHHYEPWVKVNHKTGAETVIWLNLHFSDLKPLPLEKISPMLLEKWCTEAGQAGKAASTINRDVAVLKAVLSKAVEWDWLKHNPLAKLKRLKTDNNAKVRYLSEAEEQRLLLALENRDQQGIEKRASANQWRMDRSYEPLPDLKGSFCDYLSPMVLISMHTGLRRGELFSLCWEQVDLERATITIVGAYAKNGKTLHIPLNSRALEALQQWHPLPIKQGLIFPNKDGQPMDNVRKSWAGVLKEAYVSHFRWHDLRHHFASRFVMAGVDLNTTRELLGHSTLELTLRYAHLAPEHKAEAVSRLVKFKGSNIQAISQY